MVFSELIMSGRHCHYPSPELILSCATGTLCHLTGSPFSPLSTPGTHPSSTLSLYELDHSKYFIQVEACCICLFLAWPVSVSIMFSRCSQVVAYVKLNNIPLCVSMWVCIYSILLLFLPISRHGDWFPSFGCMTDACYGCGCRHSCLFGTPAFSSLEQPH